MSIDSQPVKTFALIGDSLATYILALRLESLGHKTVLVHSGEGNWHSLLHSPRISFYPAIDSLRTTITELGSALGQTLYFESKDLPPLTFNDKEPKPFVGFGDSKNPATQILSKYNVSSRLQIEPSLIGALELAIQNLKAKRHTFSELTEFKFDGEKIEKLIIHGGQEITADHFVFMNSPAELLALIPSELIGARLRSRLAKTPVFCEITLVLEHAQPLISAENLIFLVPSNEQNEPLVGQSFGTRSVWQTYIANELNEDSEHVSNVIKGLRRLVRKAFAQEADPAPQNLIVTPGAAADLTWLSEQKELVLVAENLTFSTPLSSPLAGLAQYIDAADSAFARLPLINVAPLGGSVLDLHP